MSDVERALEVFSESVLLDPGLRAAYLDRACAGDADLRAQVERMLAADARTDPFLAEPLSEPRINRSGENVGIYRLDALIGSGANVYRATRADGVSDKPVAMKLLVFDAGDARERFVHEQRILGQLHHPNIARLLAVGQDANGGPYFVMEYIDGVPITRFVAAHGLDLRARLTLFLPILDAVQDAHTQLVVHLDIKPGNVLVDRQRRPKLLDFGIAKLLDTTGSTPTRTGLGTPEYASPEQVRGEHVGTAADVYSLGVLLFEIVTGQRPYAFPDMRPSTVERVVCEASPANPSTLPLVQVHDGNARDLDAILRRALEKSPAKRYRSCAEFADDIRRWLAGDGVLARTPPRAERVRRFVRRHRLAVAAGGIATLALIAGSAVALWQARVAREQARIAIHERDRAQQASKFLSDALGAANPSYLGLKATVVEALARARAMADKELTADPATTASAQLVLAKTYRALADYGAARERAQRDRALLGGRDEPGLQIEADLALAAAQYDLGSYEESARSASAARQLAEQAGSALQRGDSASLLGEIAMQDGSTSRAIEWYERALAEYPDAAAEDRAEVYRNYAAAEHRSGDDVAALAMYRAGVALLAAAHAEKKPVGISLYSDLAAALLATGKLDAAIEMLTEHVLPQQVETLGESSPDVASTLINIAGIEFERKDNLAMLDYALRAYRISDHLPDGNPGKIAAIKCYGLSLVRSGTPADAVAVIERALKLARVNFPADDSNVASLENWLGLALSLSGQRHKGESLARAAYERLAAKYGDQYGVTVEARRNLEQIQALGEPAR
ncbi:MAG: protein kinase [Rudaea sp.]